MSTSNEMPRGFRVRDYKLMSEWLAATENRGHMTDEQLAERRGIY